MATLRKTVPTTSVYKKLWWHFNVYQREMPRPAKHGDAALAGAGAGDGPWEVRPTMVAPEKS
jgi:hypothetical protein